jgi:16S rRNA A1518/A1519 N6-dimethyltransferase RsmA/KsgA/DIM1 with predicted DNA glycosylase/AP lyase activity
MVEVIRLDRDRDELRRLARLVRAGFAHRRKTLRHNLIDLVGRDAIDGVEGRSPLDFGRRPETLALTDWELLAADAELRAALRAGE